MKASLAVTIALAASASASWSWGFPLNWGGSYGDITTVSTTKTLDASETTSASYAASKVTSIISGPGSVALSSKTSVASSGVLSVAPVSSVSALSSKASSAASSSIPVRSVVSSGPAVSSSLSALKTGIALSSPSMASAVGSSVSAGSISRASASASRSAGSASGSGTGRRSSTFGTGTGASTCAVATTTVTASCSSYGTESSAGSSSTFSAISDSTSCNPSATPIPPKQDPWYSAPAGYESTSPGTILKVREACGLVSQISNSSAAWQILYRTTNSMYNASFAVTTILVPITPVGQNLLSYQIPYDSADLNSSPSYTLYSGGGLFGDADIAQALGRGNYVVTSDYEGPLASFTAGVTSGHATLDSVRACLSDASPVKLDNPKYALWGYSGGALAGEWALELAVQYAPELNFAGAALGGLTPNVSSVLLTINGTIYAGLAPSGILGLASQFPDAEAYLQAHLFQTGPYNASTFNAARNESLAGSIGAFAGQNIALYFTNGFDALLSPVSQRIINSDGIMGYHGVPKPPIFAYKAIGDDISVVADTDRLIDRYCQVGATIDYQRNTVGNHATELNNGVPRAVAFLTSVFAGTYTNTGCQITNVTVTA